MGTKPLTGAGYLHWGRFREGNFLSQEPNNLTRAEFCGLGNASQAFGNAWGWADANCSMLAPFICEVSGRACTCCARGQAAGAHHVGTAHTQQQCALLRPCTHSRQSGSCTHMLSTCRFARQSCRPPTLPHRATPSSSTPAGLDLWRRRQHAGQMAATWPPSRCGMQPQLHNTHQPGTRLVAACVLLLERAAPNSSAHSTLHAAAAEPGRAE